jgi:hypothetical protein
MNMRTRSTLIVVVGLVTAISTFCARASAQELGQAGNLAFSAERLFGFYISQRSIEVGTGAGTVEVDSDVTAFALGWHDSPSVLTRPRLALDYFINENLTLGGAFGLYVLGDDADETGVLFAGRVGYALRLSHAVSFWPRGGLAFHSLSGAGNNDAHLLALTIDAPFTLAPSEGWAFTVGPNLDLGLVGEINDADMTELCFGVMVGLMGWVEL